MTENATEQTTSNSADTAPGRGSRAPLHAVPGDGRRPIKVGNDPESIRALTLALDQRLLQDTYVHDGDPIVLQTISGAAEMVAGDEDAPAPMRPTVLRPALLAHLLAEQAEVFRTRHPQGWACL